MELQKTIQSDVIIQERDLINEYGNSLVDDNFPASTIGKYVSIARSFYSFIELSGRSEVKKSDIIHFLNRNENIAPHTWNNYLTYLRQFFKYLQSEKMMPDITVGIRNKKVDRKFYKESIPENIISELYLYFENRILLCERSTDKRKNPITAHRNLVYFGVLISLGSRAGATTKIRIKDVREKVLSTGNIPSIGILEKGKSNLSFKPIPQFLFKAFEAYLECMKDYSQDDFLFRSFKAGSDRSVSISYRQMWDVITRAFIAIGIKNKTTHKNEITPHSLRHSLAELIMEKHGLEYLQKFYNHSSINTTQMYAGRESEKKLFQNPPDIQGFFKI